MYTKEASGLDSALAEGQNKVDSDAHDYDQGLGTVSIEACTLLPSLNLHVSKHCLDIVSDVYISVSGLWRYAPIDFMPNKTSRGMHCVVAPEVQFQAPCVHMSRSNMCARTRSVYC